MRARIQAASIVMCMVSAAPAALAETATPTSRIESHVSHLLAGSGEWRAPNPDFVEGSSEPEMFGMNYRWGPYEQYVAAEIVSIYPSGKTEPGWSMYITHNPVTNQTIIQQTGASGIYFRGEMEDLGNGLHTETGLIYFPNGTVKSVRDEVEMIDDSTRISRVFERGENGGWVQVREWTWKLVEAAN